MNYEIVNLEEKKVSGFKTRTSIFSETMQQDIGRIWQDFFKVITSDEAKNLVITKAIGLYNNYAGDHHQDFDAYACCEVPSFDGLPKGFVAAHINAGKYAKFVATGEMRKIVGEFWANVWKLPLDRTYAGDFEEYVNDDMENAEINFYISIK